MALSLMPGEEKMAEVRQHWLTTAPPIAAMILGLIVLYAFLRWLPQHILGQDIRGLIGFLALAGTLIVVVAIALKYLRWRFTTYTLTDRRIVLMRGVVSKMTESIGLDRVQDTIMRRPLLDRLIGASDIQIESAGREGAEVLRRIPQGEQFYNQLLQAIERHRIPSASAPGIAGTAPGEGL